MDCLAILDSGNYAFLLCRNLEKKGFIFEVVSIPCRISSGGCGYCLKFPEQYKDLVLKEAAASRLAVREVFRIIPMFMKNGYEKIH